MRILLLAYEFPPSTSPQSLRWERLAGGLAARGHRVVVVTPDWQGNWTAPDGVRVERTSPGWLPALFGRLASARRGGATGSRPLPIPRFDPALNMRGLAASVLSMPVEAFCFPDLRAQWNASAAPRMRELLSSERPDVVITSHEPASVLELGFLAAEQGIPWVADLGDPVLAPYTPRRWRARAKRLEARVCRRASAVLVTSEAYRDHLAATYSLDPDACTVLRQGFGPAPPGAAAGIARHTRRGACLELVFTGRFYRFRDPRPLLAAMAGVPETRLTIATPAVGAAYEPLLEALGDRARVLGMLTPAETYTLQRQADILLSIGNTLALQVPGKLFEYLGAGRPILHLAGLEHDEGGRIVLGHRRGWVVANETEAIRSRLSMLVDDWKQGTLGSGLDLAGGGVERYSWPSLSATLETILEKTANGV